MWFGSIFLFLVPLFLTVLAVRAGTSFFRYIGRHSNDHAHRSDQYYFPEDVNPWGPRRVGGYDARIFKLADRREGRLTISDVVIETGLSVEEAEQLMQKMVDNTRVRMEVDDRGMVFYEFPEIMDRHAHNSDDG